jgi:hypothetical protein
MPMIPASSDPSRLVSFRGGFVAPLVVVERLIAIEARGARFVPLIDGRFKVEPPSALTPEDTAFLKAHRDEARRVLAYQADDSHLFADQSRSGGAPADGRKRGAEFAN